MLDLNEKAVMVEVKMPPIRQLEQKVSQWIREQYGSQRIKVTEMNHVGPYYKRIEERGRYFFVDLSLEGNVIPISLEEIQCCGEFNYRIAGELYRSFGCNRCKRSLPLEVYPLAKVLLLEFLEWESTYEDWTLSHLLSKAVEMVQAYDEKGLGITKKVREGLHQALLDDVVRVVYSPTGWS